VRYPVVVLYSVIATDGNKYGPADVATLNQWIGEGRLMPNQMLEEETSGARVAASAVSGLNFPMQNAQPGPEGFQPGQPYQNYYARPGVPMGDDGSKDVQQAWIWAVVSFFCCAPITAWLAINAAKRAQEKGNPGANAPRVVAIIALVVWVILLVVRVASIGSAVNSGQIR
jgi:hypothetical protein